MLREHDLLAEFGWVIQEAVTYLKAAFFKLMISRSNLHQPGFWWFMSRGGFEHLGLQRIIPA